MIPIIINTTSRTEYLPYLFNSLLASDIGDAKIHICANSSSDMFERETEVNKSLTAEITSAYGGGVEQARRISLPDIKCRIKPLSEFAEINVINRDLKHVKKVQFILEHYFNKFPDAQFLIILKDDTVFNRNWLKNILKIYEKKKNNLGFIADCDLNCNVFTPNYIETEQNIKTGYVNAFSKQKGRCGSSQCYLITREFYEKWHSTKLGYRTDYNTPFNDSTDIIMNQATMELEFENFLTIPQYTEHIGVHSTRFFNRKLPFTHLFKGDICYDNKLEVK